jgi:hypothetical protein
MQARTNDGVDRLHVGGNEFGHGILGGGV